jgi:histidinol-phosphate aminotransferase
MSLADLSRRDAMRAVATTGASAVIPATYAANAPSIARLSLNESAIGPSPAVTKAILGALRDIAYYVDPSEVDALARQIARFEGVAPEQVVVG